MTRALVLSGGGARGAYQVGILKAFAETVPEGTQPFSIITGVSVGALNASVLASSPEDFPAGMRKLETIWRELHCDHVFITHGGEVRGRLASWAGAVVLGWAGVHAPPSLLDNSPLLELLDTYVDFDKVNESLGDGPLAALAITASSYATGRAITFFNGHTEIEPWDRARRSGCRTELRPEHVLASSALPLIFPAVQVGPAYFGDGSLREAAPLSAAIHLGAEQILTIGARDNDPDPEPTAEMEYPTVGYLSGQMLDILFNDNTQADIERAMRINETLAAMRPESRAKTTLRPLDITAVNPSEDLRPIAGQHLEDMPGSLKLLMRSIGALNAPWVLPSYLMFEPGYIGALIDLGLKDGRKLFGTNPKPPVASDEV